MTIWTQEPVQGFKLAQGSSIFRRLRPLGATMGSRRRLRLQAFVLSSVTWVPLLLLSIFDTYFNRTDAVREFLLNFTIHVRFLVALPLLIVAESAINKHVGAVVDHLSHSGIVVDEDLSKLNQAVQRTQDTLDSTAIETLLVVLIAVNSFVSIGAMAENYYSFWNIGPVLRQTFDRPQTLWFTTIAAPIFQFILLRWIWRIAVWWRLLMFVASLKLRLAGTHPDRVGGLGFITIAQAAFGLIVFPISAVLAAHIATVIHHEPKTLLDFKGLIGVFVLSSVLIFLAPLLVFTPKLARTKRETRLEYGAIALAYTQQFEGKWLEKPSPPKDKLLGTVDIQSLADLGTSFAVAEEMSVFLLGRNVIKPLATAALVPMIPLVLTLLPVSELFKLMFKILV